MRALSFLYFSAFFAWRDERVEPLLQLAGDVGDAQEVGLGGLHLALGGLAAGLVLGDAGGLLDEAAAVLRLAGDDEAHPALLDDGVGLGAHAGAEEQLGDVLQAAHASC